MRRPSNRKTSYRLDILVSAVRRLHELEQNGRHYVERQFQVGAGISGDGFFEFEFRHLSLTCSFRLKRKSDNYYKKKKKNKKKLKSLYQLLTADTLSIRLELLIFQIHYSSYLIARFFSYRESYKSKLIAVEQFENRLGRLHECEEAAYAKVGNTTEN